MARKGWLRRDDEQEGRRRDDDEGYERKAGNVERWNESRGKASDNYREGL